ncbi:MAG: lipid A deacylase LpxR family protein [Planctomycetota bacterium]
MRGFLISAMLWLGLSAAPSAAQPVDDGPSVEARESEPYFRIGVTSENDGTFLKPWGATDRHYTNGFGATVTWQSQTTKDVLDAFLPKSDGAAFGLGFGHEIHTPNDLLANPPDPDDRPYAGYLFGSAFVQRQVNRDRFDHFDGLRVDVGLVGPSAHAKGVQVAIHDTFDGDDPKGWDDQLRDEFAFQVQYQRKLRFDTGSFDLFGIPLDTQAVPLAEINVGTVRRDLGGSLMYRFGVRLPDDFGPDQFRDPQSLTGDPFAHARGVALDPLFDQKLGRGGVFNAYGFLRAGLRYVEWSTFLDGNYERDPGPGVSKEPLVGEFEVGVVVGYVRGTNSFELAYSTTWLTDQFQSQSIQNSVGALSVRWTLAF